MRIVIVRIVVVVVRCRGSGRIVDWRGSGGSGGHVNWRGRGEKGA